MGINPDLLPFKAVSLSMYPALGQLRAGHHLTIECKIDGIDVSQCVFIRAEDQNWIQSHAHQVTRVKCETNKDGDTVLSLFCENSRLARSLYAIPDLSSELPQKCLRLRPSPTNSTIAELPRRDRWELAGSFPVYCELDQAVIVEATALKLLRILKSTAMDYTIGLGDNCLVLSNGSGSVYRFHYWTLGSESEELEKILDLSDLGAAINDLNVLKKGIKRYRDDNWIAALIVDSSSIRLQLSCGHCLATYVFLMETNQSDTLIFALPTGNIGKDLALYADTEGDRYFLRDSDGLDERLIILTDPISQRHAQINIFDQLNRSIPAGPVQLPKVKDYGLIKVFQGDFLWSYNCPDLVGRDRFFGAFNALPIALSLDRRPKRWLERLSRQVSMLRLLSVNPKFINFIFELNDGLVIIFAQKSHGIPWRAIKSRCCSLAGQWPKWYRPTKKQRDHISQ